MNETNSSALSWITQRYQLQEQIGYGGLSNVFRAWDHHLKRPVAVKCMKCEGDQKVDKVVQDALREAMTTASVRHPNVVTVFDYGTEEKTAYIVMELVDGENLEQCLQRGPLHINDFHKFATQSLEGIIATHSMGMMHRDLKPANFMLQPLVTGSFEVKILDFGLAKYVDKPQPQSVDHFNSLVGSIHYMAPEQLDQKLIDKRTDLYSFGCVSYEALTGHTAFDGQTVAELVESHVKKAPHPLAELRPEVSSALESWLMKFLEKNPDSRPQTARAALDSLPPVNLCSRTGRRTIRGLFEKFLGTKTTTLLPPAPSDA
jgi:eukaryotic-like serine/threonine-protein kinase